MAVFEAASYGRFGFRDDARRVLVELRDGKQVTENDSVPIRGEAFEDVRQHPELAEIVKETVPGLYGYVVITRTDGTMMIETDSHDVQPNPFDSLPPGPPGGVSRLAPRGGRRSVAGTAGWPGPRPIGPSRATAGNKGEE